MRREVIMLPIKLLLQNNFKRGIKCEMHFLYKNHKYLVRVSVVISVYIVIKLVLMLFSVKIID